MSYRLEVGPTPTGETALVVTQDTATLVDNDGQASSWRRAEVSAVRLVVGYGIRSPHIHHVQLVGYEGETLAAVPWDSERHGPIERLCRQAQLPMEAYDDLEPALIQHEQELTQPLTAAPPGQTSVALIVSRRLVTVRAANGTEHTWPRVGAGDPHEPQVARVRKYCHPHPLPVDDDLELNGPGDLLTGLIFRGVSRTLAAIATDHRMPPKPPGELIEGVALLDPDNRMLCLIQARGYTSDHIDFVCARVAIAVEDIRTAPITRADAKHGAIFIPEPSPSQV